MRKRAQRFNRPLFPITCGDLGTNAKGVEKSLNGIFRLAHLWDCILLLDEADIFVSQRDRLDLNRNAHVSVFLRMFEYYNGVLFLTTNRPGVLDEGVKSRVHLSLLYEALDHNQTMDIFKLNIDRLRNIENQRASARQNSGYVKLLVNSTSILDFAKKHFERAEKDQRIGRWSGRQIRNAFLIAASLAHFEGDKQREEDPDFPTMLNATHFQTVEETTEEYDKYRLALCQNTDDGQARQRQDRLDGSDPKSPGIHVNGSGGGQSMPRATYQD